MDADIPLELNTSVRPPEGDDSTLFISAGMQRFKSLFADTSYVGTVANIQSCLRLNDLEEVGDGTHCLRFDMMGLFSFRQMAVGDGIAFWHAYLRRIGITPTHVTVHPDRTALWRDLHPADIEVRPDPDCTWSDGGTGGYCTEFYVGDIEIGNIVNPRGDCLDVGFGLQRLEHVLGVPPPSAVDLLREGISAILDAGYVPGNKAQGYALRRLLRTLWRQGGTLDHPVFHAERQRQERLRAMYHRLAPRHPGMSAAWWFDTHGIVLADVEDT
ncbi:alanine--tRNA ligase-related protein [Reyranella sp. CPCC 100927]|uniref:alanine--tRNA ligase-related protein n=1 Tax=Reyranella sp. CPCC 100927 TaxID=2599616 RepID=UPI0021050BD2|nr:alanine--tRNA ligase-related protein [Reyranella sp. CPCC 100927]